MLDFQLFRIKVRPSHQGVLFDQQKSPSEILQEVVLSLPSAEFRKDMIWHIGNVTSIDKNGLYFRVGRTSKSKIEIYHNGNFVDQQFETAPYTHVLLDIHYEIVAIAKKTKLSPTTAGIARQFVRLLIESEKNRVLRAIFEIGQINDPKDFVDHLRRAYAISKFWISFTRPNPFDANKDFIVPMEKLLNESNGEKGKTELIGKNLSADKLEELARSAASTGDDAGAVLQPEGDSKRIRKQLKGNAVIVPWEDLSDDTEKHSLLQTIRDIYHRIKGNGENL